MLPEADVRSWLEIALEDLQTGVAALNRRPPLARTAAFHAQQAVEKALKAFLVWKAVEFEKIHDLEELAELCVRADAAFAGWPTRLAPLTAFAVRFRYPGPPRPMLEQVRAAMVIAEEVWEFVTARLPAQAVPPRD
jgi:HEPN domain-containing protein